MYVRTCMILMLILGLFTASAHAQGELIGSRGGSTTPPATTTPTTPVLPPSLHLPDNAQSTLLQGLNSSGTALRPGMGWLVSQLTHEGIHGQQLADVIHQLKPYKQRGVLTFPQPTNGTGTTQQTFPQHGGFERPDHDGGGRPQGLPGGFGHGNGKKR